MQTIEGGRRQHKQNKDQQIMEIMKRLTAIKQKIEKRLKGFKVPAA